jgi:hypothetical protein
MMRNRRTYCGMKSGRFFLSVLAAIVTAIGTSGAAGQETGPRSHEDLPGPNRLWFLEPLMPFLGARPSSSMEPVSFELTNSAQTTTRLRIPRAYISRVSEPGQVSQSFVRLAVYLPDYLPRFLADQAGHQTRGKLVKGIELRSPDELGITVEATIPGAEAKIIDSVRSRTLAGGKFGEEFEIRYHARLLSPDSEPVPRKESGYLIPIARNDFSISFAASPSTGEMIGCTLRFSFKDRLAVQVSFSAKQLDRYREIREAVSEMLDRFIVN